jgi:phosphoglycolate phosphatase
MAGFCTALLKTPYPKILNETGQLPYMNKYPQAVVFDLDGTLVDTGPDLTAALNYSLQLEGLAPVPLAAVRDMVGHGARKLIERGMAYHQMSLTEARADDLWRAFIDYYAANICVHSQPYPGMIDALKLLHGQGIKLGICTNKPEALSHKLIAALNLSHFFLANLGSDSLPVRKPNAQHLLGTLAAMQADPHSAVMVGDSMVDVNTARSAKIPIIAVTFGFSDIPATDFNADALIDHYDNLGSAVEAAYNRR